MCRGESASEVEPHDRARHGRSALDPRPRPWHRLLPDESDITAEGRSGRAVRDRNGPRELVKTNRRRVRAWLPRGVGKLAQKQSDLHALSARDPSQPEDVPNVGVLTGVGGSPTTMRPAAGGKEG